MNDFRSEIWTIGFGNAYMEWELNPRFPMTIRGAIAKILVGYGSAKSQPFAGHAIAKVVRRDFPEAARAIIPEERYLVEGSAGQGQWAEVPWTAVFEN
jgi:hypothetical protein